MSDSALPTRKQFMQQTDAGFFAKRGETIRAIDDLLDHYQTLRTEFAKGIAAFKIIEYCNEYEAILVKQNRGSQRWSGVHRLRGLAAAEYKRLLPLIKAKVNFKGNAPAPGAARARQNFSNLMHNPKFKVLGEIQNRGNQPNAKRLVDGEILEVLDDLHRVGHGLKKIHNQWLYDMTTTKNFWDYLEDYLKAHPNETPYRVKYLQENERRAYQIRFRGGQLFQGEIGRQHPFDTKNLMINKANPSQMRGKAIFVMSIEKEIFSGGSFSNPTTKPDGHIDLRRSGDILHHSSFLMGKPVLCAGEWTIESGAIICLTPLSGHYQPPVPIFQSFLRHLKNCGVLIDRITVEWTFNGAIHYYNAAEFAAANQVAFNNQPFHNGVALREVRNMREATVYKSAPLPQNAPPLPPRNNQTPPNPGRPAPPIPQPGHRPAPPIPQPGQTQNPPARRWAPVQSADRFGR